MAKLTEEEARAVFKIPGIEGLPAPEYIVPLSRTIQLYVMVLLKQKKPENLSVAEDAVWDRLQEEVASAPKGTIWSIPTE